MKVLAIDVGGTHVKILATDQKAPQKFVSGPKMTAKQMVSTVKARSWLGCCFYRISRTGLAWPYPARTAQPWLRLGEL
jgi:hypothetical protein